MIDRNKKKLQVVRLMIDIETEKPTSNGVNDWESNQKKKKKIREVGLMVDRKM